MILTHKITLDLNNKQTTYCQQSAGTARFAYNWALANWDAQYQAWKQDNSQPKPSEAALRRQLNAVKREQFPWMLKVTKNAPQMAIIQLGKAFKNFFAGRAKYPVFKKKGRCRDSFELTNDQFAVDGLRLRIPHLGWVRMRESLRFSGKIISATISRTAQKWFVSISVETNENPHLRKAENQGVAGVDLGIKTLATISANGKFEEKTGSKPLKRYLNKLKGLSRKLSRKVKGSANRAKSIVKVAKLHAKIVNIRQHELHDLTTSLTRRFHTIGIEDLNVKGMVKNHKLSRAINDMGFFEFRRQLEYKAQMRGGIVVVADRWFPSSKLCSTPGCGFKIETLDLSVREWTCPKCNTVHQRDQNAATNLANYTVSYTVSACGAEGSGL